MLKIAVPTGKKSQLVEITREIAQAVDRSKTAEGICHIYCPHTTGGVLVNERADPAVASDISNYMSEIVREDRQWSHLEGNSPAHIKAALVGESAVIPIESGKLVLGKWQGIFFCEFDGPRERNVLVAIQPS